MKEYGIAVAKKHGYVDVTTSNRTCRLCAFSGGEQDSLYEKPTVWCRMFEFRARSSGTCEEWEAKK